MILHVRYQHRCNVEYDQVFHLVTSLFEWVMDQWSSFSVADYAPGSPDTDGPSDRNYSLHELHSHALPRRQM